MFKMPLTNTDSLKNVQKQLFPVLWYRERTVSKIPKTVDNSWKTVENRPVLLKTRSNFD